MYKFVVHHHVDNKCSIFQSWSVSFVLFKCPNTLGPAYDEQFDAQKCARGSRVLDIAELVNIVAYDGYFLNYKLFARSNRVLVVSGTHCIYVMYFFNVK